MKVFTPRRMVAVEDLVREFCASALDPLRDEEGFDFVADLAVHEPAAFEAIVGKAKAALA